LVHNSYPQLLSTHRVTQDVDVCIVCVFTHAYCMSDRVREEQFVFMCM